MSSLTTNSHINLVILESSPKFTMKYTMTVSLLERNKHLLTSLLSLFSYTDYTMQLSVPPFNCYLLEHFNIICTNFLENRKSPTEPQNIVTWISISFEILNKPPFCVRQCGTSFLLYS